MKDNFVMNVVLAGLMVGGVMLLLMALDDGRLRASYDPKLIRSSAEILRGCTHTERMNGAYVWADCPR